MVHKAAFLAAKCHGQYGIVFFSLQQELPVVQQPDCHASLNIFLPSLWLFCHYFCHLDFIISLLVHPSQVSSSSQRASHPSASTSLRHQGESSPSAMKPEQAQVLQLPLCWGLGGWLAKKGKGTSVAELCQQCNNAQIGSGPLKYHKIKTAFISTERAHEVASKNDSSSLSVQTSTLTARSHSLYKYPLLRSNLKFFYFLDAFSLTFSIHFGNTSIYCALLRSVSLVDVLLYSICTPEEGA